MKGVRFFMAKITEELLKMLNIDANTIGDYSGVERKGENYVLKLNDGSSRTYSPGIFFIKNRKG